MEVLDKETDKKVYSLRSRANTQKQIAAAAKEYQSAKFEADSLKIIGVRKYKLQPRKR